MAIGCHEQAYPRLSYTYSISFLSAAKNAPSGPPGVAIGHHAFMHVLSQIVPIYACLAITQPVCDAYLARRENLYALA